MSRAICECGEATGHACANQSNPGRRVLVDVVPESDRASHTAVGNKGVWPHNGAMRLRVSRACAKDLIDAAPEWVTPA